MSSNKRGAEDKLHWEVEAADPLPTTKKKVG